MAAETVMLNEIVDASIDEELLINHDDHEEFHLISATVAFMKRNLKRIAGFYDVVVPSSDPTFEVLAQELAATGTIPTENRFGGKPIPCRSRFWHLRRYGNLHTRKPVLQPCRRRPVRRSILAWGLELVKNCKWLVYTLTP